MKASVTLQEVDGEILMPIPDELLAALRLSVGTDVEVRCENGRLVIQPLRARHIQKHYPRLAETKILYKP